MILFTRRTRIPFQVDEEDSQRVSLYAWTVSTLDGYLRANLPANTPSGITTILLPKFILGPPLDGLQWDHKNRDRLDNRRLNLRAVTPEVNSRNIGISTRNRSGVRGVTLEDDRLKQWRAEIYYKGRSIYLGNFKTLEEASLARQTAEIKYWGAACQ